MDLAFVLDERVPAAAVLATVRAAGGTWWRTSGCSTSSGPSRSARASAASPIAIRFRAPDRTMKDKELAKVRRRASTPWCARTAPSCAADARRRLQVGVRRHRPLGDRVQVAPAGTAGIIETERLEVVRDGGGRLRPVVEVGVAHGGRVHVVTAEPGRLSVDYAATFRPVPGPRSDRSTTAGGTSATRRSKGCARAGTARRTRSRGSCTSSSAARRRPALRARPARSRRGCSSASTTCRVRATRSTPRSTRCVAGSGVCRDFAHLTDRAVSRRGGSRRGSRRCTHPGSNRWTSTPVTEVLTPEGWCVLDSTRLAPRPTLARIATGRDAADTAFATTLRGDVELLEAGIHASSDGACPLDDHVLVVARLMFVHRVRPRRDRWQMAAVRSRSPPWWRTK